MVVIDLLEHFFPGPGLPAKRGIFQDRGSFGKGLEKRWKKILISSR